MFNIGDECKIQSGMRGLYCAVILRAFEDAQYMGKNRELKSEKKICRQWLTKPSASLLHVCDVAEIDYKTVNRVAIERFGLQ